MFEGKEKEEKGVLELVFRPEGKEERNTSAKNIMKSQMRKENVMDRNYKEGNLITCSLKYFYIWDIRFRNSFA